MRCTMPTRTCAARQCHTHPARPAQASPWRVAAVPPQPAAVGKRDRQARRERACRAQLSGWLQIAARAKRRKLSMVSATFDSGQRVTGVLVPHCAYDAFRNVLHIHEAALRARLDADAAAALRAGGGGPAQPGLARALIDGANPARRPSSYTRTRCLPVHGGPRDSIFPVWAHENGWPSGAGVA